MWFLIQNIKKLIEQGNVSVIDTLREGNQCMNFMAKLKTSSNLELIRQDFPLTNLLSLLRSGTAETFFLSD